MNKKELIAAYLDTNYVVCEGDNRLVIRIQERNHELDEFLDKHGVREWVFITAFNPFSQQLSDEENKNRQSELCVYLESRELNYVPGFGEASDGSWIPEPSLLVLGIDREAAIELARKLEQNAIVVGNKGGKPELVWIG